MRVRSELWKGPSGLRRAGLGVGGAERLPVAASGCPDQRSNVGFLALNTEALDKTGVRNVNVRTAPGRL